MAYVLFLPVIEGIHQDSAMTRHSNYKVSCLASPFLLLSEESFLSAWKHSGVCMWCIRLTYPHCDADTMILSLSSASSGSWALQSSSKTSQLQVCRLLPLASCQPFCSVGHLTTPRCWSISGIWKCWPCHQTWTLVVHHTRWHAHCLALVCGFHIDEITGITGYLGWHCPA